MNDLLLQVCAVFETQIRDCAMIIRRGKGGGGLKNEPHMERGCDRCVTFVIIRPRARALEIKMTFELLTKQKLLPLRKLNLEEKTTGDVNKNASLKNDIKFVVAPFIYAIQKWLLTPGDLKRRSSSVYFIQLRSDEVSSTFPIARTFETTPYRCF